MWTNISFREPVIVKRYRVKLEDGSRPMALWSAGAFWINGEKLSGVVQWMDA